MSAIQFHLGMYFPSQEAATVVVSSPELPAREYLFGSLLMFTNYATRTISNLGKSETADILVRSLASIDLVAIAETDTVGGVRLSCSEKPPKKYEKSFTSRLDASVSRGVPNIKFDYKYSGFGWLGRGLGFYAPLSVLGLVWDNAKRIGSVPGAAAAWAEAASGIAKVYAIGQIGVANQRELALVLAATCGQGFAPDEWLAVLPPG